MDYTPEGQSPAGAAPATLRHDFSPLPRPLAPPAAPRPALRLDQPDVLEVEQDVLEELQRDALRLGELGALDRLAVGGGGQLEGGAHGVVGFG